MSSAIFTRATSSGDEAWYSFTPLLVIGVTLWQTESAVTRSLRIMSLFLLIEFVDFVLDFA